MSLIYKSCVHAPVDVDGENTCIRCGIVFGRTEVQSISDWQSHEVKLIGSKKLAVTTFKIAKNLNLPNCALQTAMQISTKLLKADITKKQAILFGIVYACRVHKVPRLLADIFQELDKTTGKFSRHSEKSLLRILNRITKKATLIGLSISPPDKNYYLQAYLAKIQDLIVKETNSNYFEMVRGRSIRIIDTIKQNPHTAAKKAILCSISRTFQSRLKEVLG